MKRPYRKRLSVDIPLQFHAELKKNAIIHNITLTKILLRIIHGYLVKERSYQNKDDHEDLSNVYQEGK
jgi:hypothetical protein